MSAREITPSRAGVNSFAGLGLCPCKAATSATAVCGILPPMRHPILRLLPFALFALIPVHAAAQDRTVALLQQLADAPGPPGFEEPIRKVMVDTMKPLASSITFDGLGSIIATQGTAGTARHGRRAHGRARRRDPPHHASRSADDADAGGMAGSGAGGSALDHHRIERAGARGHRHPRRPRRPRRGAHARLSRATASSSTSAPKTKRRSPRWASDRAIRSCPTRRSR